MTKTEAVIVGLRASYVVTTPPIGPTTKTDEARIEKLHG